MNRLGDPTDFSYRVSKVTKVVDGDTIDVILDMGFDIMYKQRVRLFGIDTPESRTRDLEEKKYGLMAKELVLTLMPVGSMQTLITEKDKSGKFGRILGKFKVHEPNLDRYVILNDFMIDNPYAVEYNGQSKQEIAEEHLRNRDKLSRTLDGIDMIRNDNRDDHMNRDNGSS